MNQMVACKSMLSLVVPVYNVAPFLDRCLQSLAAQDLSAMEIILVDDGSTDACPEILAGYAARYPQMKVIRRENGGLSAARNTGLDAAQGKYVAFVDSDDWIEPDYYPHMLDLAEKHDLDMVHGNGIYHFEGRQADIPIYRDDMPTEVMSGRQVLKHRLGNKTLLHMVWLHLYRRSLIESEQLRFVPPYIHEDVVWTTRAFLAAKRVAYWQSPGYHYRQRMRRFDAQQQDTRLPLIIDSSIFNARELDRLAAAEPDAVLARLLRWQLTDGALSIFHKVDKFSSASLKHDWYRRLRREGVFGLLWRNAVAFSQQRRIARNWLKALRAGK